jgi:ABC-2 type transport system permease protein
VARALVFLWAASARNRLRLQLRRLRQPRSLLGLLAAGTYLYWLVVRRLSLDGPVRVLSPAAATLWEVPLLLLGLASVASAWLFGRDRPLVTFTEAEVQLLFPAPLTRRQLLHAKLARFLGRGLVGALLSTILLGRTLAGHPVSFAIGSWLGLSILGLHATAASLTRAALAQRGASRVWRRALPVGVALGYASLLGGAVWNVGLPPLGSRPDLELLALWVDEVLGSGPLTLLLAPVRLPLQVALARDASTLAWALPLSVGLLVLHYRWVLATDVAFEEAALEGAEARAAKGGGRRDWRAGVEGRRARPPFRLAPTGPPGWALVWKNLTAGRRQRSGRLAGGALAVTTAGLLLVFTALPSQARVAGVGAVCLALAGFLVLFGPGALRLDLRLDLPVLEQLKALPLTGRQVVAAELAAPTVVLGAMQWVLLAAGFLLSLGSSF